MPTERPLSTPPRTDSVPSLPFLAVLPAVAVVTALLYRIQHVVPGNEMTLPRPYSIGYILLVAAFTTWGGWKPGAFSLGLSVLATLFFLVAPTFALWAEHPRDWVELALLTLVGVVVVVAIHQARGLRDQMTGLLAESEESRARLRAVMDAAPIGIMTCDPKGILTFANAEAERIWGQSLQNVSQEEWGRYNLLYPDGTPIPPANMGLARALRGEAPVIKSELIIGRPDNVRVPVESQSTRVLDTKGTVLGAVAAFLDVTERHRFEEALRASEENYRFVAETMPQIIWTTRPDGWHEYFNSRWFEYTGLTLEETQGWGWSHLLHPDDRERTLALWNHCLATGDRYSIEYRFRRASDGEYRWFLGMALPQRDEDGRIIRWHGTCTDIDDHKREQIKREWRAEAEALLYRIGRAQRVTDDPEQVRTVALEELGRALQTDRCFMALLDHIVQKVVVADYRRPDLPTLAGETPLRDFVQDLQLLFPEGVSIAVRDLSADSRFAPFAAVLESSRLCSTILVPLYEEATLTAILGVAMAETRRDWTQEEISLCESVATQTRTTMELAALRRREHNIAERLQEALKPSLPDAVPGLKLAEYYLPALAEASIGGDFYDVFLIEKGCVALVVGDLSGKGLAAAAQIATVRNMLRFALYRSRTVAEAMRELNDILTEHDLLTGFATLFVGLFDAGTGAFTYVSCGHEPGLLRRANGVMVEMEATGPILGAFHGAVYSQRTVTLEPGDAIILYTDGLSEAGRNRHEFLGVEGIAAACTAVEATVSPEAMVQHIIERVDAHTHGAPHDDECLLVAFITGKG